LGKDCKLHNFAVWERKYAIKRDTLWPLERCPDAFAGFEEATLVYSGDLEEKFNMYKVSTCSARYTSQSTLPE